MVTLRLLAESENTSFSSWTGIIISIFNAPVICAKCNIDLFVNDGSFGAYLRIIRFYNNRTLPLPKEALSASAGRLSEVQIMMIFHPLFQIV